MKYFFCSREVTDSPRFLSHYYLIMWKKTVFTLLSVGLLVITTTAQLGQAPDHYLHPHEVFHRVSELHSSMSLESDSINTLIEALSHPQAIFQQSSLLGSNVSETCANQTLYLLDSLLDGGGPGGNGWTTDSEYTKLLIEHPRESVIHIFALETSFNT